MRLANAFRAHSHGPAWSVVGAAMVLLTMGVAAGPARAAVTQPLFYSPVSYDVATDPLSLAVADLNGDGRPDIVTVGGSFSLTLLFGNDQGYFGGRVDYPLPNGGMSVAAGDLDGDGDLDLVVVSYLEVMVFLNPGNGVFGPPSYRYAFGSSLHSLALADLNGDHVLDVAVTDEMGGSGTVPVLLGNGDGTFQDHVDYPAGSAPLDLVAGDLNRDGHPDLVDVNSLGIVAPSRVGENAPSTDPSTVSVLLNGGQGTFDSPVGYFPSTFAVDIAIGDVTGDGIPDLVESDSYSCACGGINVLPGKGDGTFGPAMASHASVSYPAHVAIADLNGDGKLDLAIGENGTGAPYDYVDIALGNGDGTFAVHETPHVGYGAISVALKDVNGDGTLDLITANAYSNTVSVAFGTTGPVGVTGPLRDGLVLEGARPDPAIAGLTVAFSLPDAAPAELSVYDVSGRRVLSRQVNGLGAGRHVLRLDPEAPIASGVYMLCLTRGNRSLVQRAVVLR